VLLREARFCFCLSRVHLQAFADVVLLAGGTGITPMYQIASAALANPANKSRFVILSFSKNDRDICMHHDLADLQLKNPSALRVKFFASEVSASPDCSVCLGSVRSFSAQQLLEHAGAAVCDSTVFCMCGPREFMASARILLEQAGAHASHVHAWL
jgi:cytochrome-b5 reductase